MVQKSKIILAVLIIGVIIIAAELIHIFWNPYWDISNAIGKQYTAEGILLSRGCDWDKGECFIKAGPVLQLCEWDYEIKNFKEAGRYPSCIWLDIWSGDKGVLDYKDYVKKKVEITGVVKSAKIGDSGEICNETKTHTSQIGCAEDIIVLAPEKIQEVRKAY